MTAQYTQRSQYQIQYCFKIRIFESVEQNQDTILLKIKFFFINKVSMQFKNN